MRSHFFYTCYYYPLTIKIDKEIINVVQEADDTLLYVGAKVVVASTKAYIAPVTLEAALKRKEISYIQTEGFVVVEPIL